MTESSSSSSLEQTFQGWLQSCCTSSTLSDTDYSGLRQQASETFRTIATSANNNNIIGIGEATTTIMDAKLSTLIQVLGPAFGITTNTTNTNDNNLLATSKSRLAALSCIQGALEGISGCSTTAQQCTLSFPVIKKLGYFLLEHCGPIEIEEEFMMEELDDQIRDVAIMGINHLFQILFVAPSSLNDETADITDLLFDQFETYLHLARTGVEKRWTIPENEDEMNYHDDEDDISNDNNNQHRYGLSLLPRSRRSMCFDLLSTTTSAIGTFKPLVNNPSQRNRLEQKLVEFATFIATCLHGESDPRCLLQLLLLFHTVLVAFQPFFVDENKSMRQPLFPIHDFFDAIVPYYPIQFSPPPNNIHGITREKLRNALVSVMTCCSYYDTFIGSCVNGKTNTMLSLSIGLLVETLAPPDEDGPVVMKEQYEALEDLNTILFPIKKMGNSIVVVVEKLTIVEIKKISDALIKIHNESSEKATVADSNHINRDLTNLCRRTICRIAVATERVTQKPELWESFVRVPVIAMLPSSSSIPTQKMALAYIANLCSCGGLRTLRLGLEMGLAPLLKTPIIDTMKSMEIGDTISMLYAVGAFFASSLATMNTLKAEGVYVHPHPLQDFSNLALDEIFTFFKDTTIPIPLRMAASKTFQSILLATPSSTFEEKMIQNIEEMIRTLVNEQIFEENRTLLNAWYKCSAEVLGMIIAESLGQHNNVNEIDGTILEQPAFKTFLNDSILNSVIVLSGGSKNNVPQQQTFGQEVLVKICSVNLGAAKIVISLLTESLSKSIHSQDYQSAKTIAYTLSFIFKSEKNFSCVAFQALSSPSVTLFDIINDLLPADEVPVDINGTDMSKLHLPPKVEDTVKNRQYIIQAEGIVSMLTSGYDNVVIHDHLLQLIHFVGTGLPPLSDNDNLKTKITLPILSLAMQNYNKNNNKNNKNLENLQKETALMTMDLADLAITTSSERVRRNATHCLHAALAFFVPTNDSTVLVSDIMKNVIQQVSTTTASAKSTKDTTGTIKAEKNAIDFANVITMTALLGSSAAIRGGPCTKIVDRIISFFLDLAFECKAIKNPIDGDNNDDTSMFEFSSFKCNDIDYSTSLSLCAASAFGILLSSAGENPLRLQRMIHISLNYMKNTLNVKEVLLHPGDVVKPGILISICHVACVGMLRNINQADLFLISDILLCGLNNPASQVTSKWEKGIPKLLLTSLLRLLCVSPSTMEGRLYGVVTGAMRTFATVDDTDVISKLLSLQLLSTVAQTSTKLGSGNNNTLKTTIKPAVVSILGVAMNHPTQMIRQAAIEVRNTWYLIE